MGEFSISARAALAGVAVLAGSVLAQAQTAAGKPGADPSAAVERVRFTVQPVEGGLMRLDTESGAMSFCAQRSSSWVCETVPDDRRALEAEIGRLQARLEALEKNRASGGGGVPDIMAPPPATSPDAAPPDASPPAASSPDADGELPAQARQRFDQAIDLAEHAFQRFVEMIERLRKDLPTDGSAATPPPKGEPF
ncbi:hypothetical protein EV667_0652 [Ancylobacter aquaticus]|uniref:Uncharacterized protein n=1 Tax=Ancylobacter aquaticus TaxID=100 RepID=A0A4R1I8P5_ANCAQ|nr:hypothetical protein [Ancylobacter aquaticus]TCK30561.1 hypothetical protein EV667_0652 [Ancylobacter aquaticus]